MLGESIATIPVRDLETAARFYEEILGLTRGEPDGDEVITFRTGASRLFVYQSAYAGTNQATAVTWPGVDVDETVRTLRDRGVRFEHYDLPGMRREGDVHVAGDMRAAWFKDPDGNIHALVSG
jgi:catechol 2,3-dioxygenase-like lactoylglutathione lyase family enzyme